MTKLIQEQYCQPAGNVYGVNVSIKADGQLVLEGPKVPDVRHEPHLRIMLTGKTVVNPQGPRTFTSTLQILRFALAYHKLCLVEGLDSQHGNEVLSMYEWFGSISLSWDAWELRR